MNPRIERLKNNVTAEKGSFPVQVNPYLLDAALYRAVKGGGSRVQIRAAFLYEEVRTAPIEIGEEWRLAGIHLPKACEAEIRHNQQIHKRDPKNPELIRSMKKLDIGKDEIEKLFSTIDRYTVTARSHVRGSVRIGSGGETTELGHGCFCGSEAHADQSLFVYSGGGWIENHSIRDYAKLLRLGWGGIRREIEKRLQDAVLSEADFIQKENFWNSALTVCDAGLLLGKRYSDLARQLARQARSPEEKERLGRMAEVCGRVCENGANNFFDAVQLLWFGHILTCGEDGINANGLGRLDQILYPYFKRDIESRRIKSDDALEIMEELACKLYLEYDVQAICLGGVDRKGKTAVNELSSIILASTKNVGLIRDVSIRIDSKTTPRHFIEQSSEMIAEGGGIPFIFNDAAFIPAMTEHGVSLEDARDYAPIGCIELTVPGKANPHAVSGWFNGLKCLELALFNGTDPGTGKQIGPSTGDFIKMRSVEDLYEAYSQQTAFFAERLVYHCNRGELLQREFGPLPCLSVLTDDCIDRGRDITDGGALYNYHSVCFMGAADIADSLSAVEMLVFDKQEITAQELLAALKSNFTGQEDIRKKLLYKAPKYGNDHSETDAYAVRAANDFIDLMDSMRSPLGGRYVVHLFTFKYNIPAGKWVGACPDGRKAGEPLAYSLSAHQGRDTKGITALISSLARMPHHRAGGASAALLEIDPALLKGEKGRDLLTSLINTALGTGVGQMQWNVVSVERLLLARQDQQHYGNIAVRVAGYSQLFKLIDKELQDHIIARTKHTS
jgi:formate C-acetyltransferase